MVAEELPRNVRGGDITLPPARPAVVLSPVTGLVPLFTRTPCVYTTRLDQILSGTGLYSLNIALVFMSCLFISGHGIGNSSLG